MNDLPTNPPPGDRTTEPPIPAMPGTTAAEHPTIADVAPIAPSEPVI